MSIMEKLKPQFWDAGGDVGPGKNLFDYQRIWRLAVLTLTVVALVPLSIMTFIDYNVTRQSLESEHLLRTARTTSNVRRQVAHFLDERKNALEYILQREGLASLRDPNQLRDILRSLKQGFGGFVDIGLIDPSGRQVAYIGPYELQNKDYGDQEWYKQTLERGYYTSEVFLGYRDAPHIIVARKSPVDAGGRSFVLRATLDTAKFNAILSSMDLAGEGDAFLVDAQGVLQTPSRWHGGVFAQANLPIPGYSEKTSVVMENDRSSEEWIVGCAYIKDSPYILLVVKKAREIMKPWQTIRLELLWTLVASILLILLVITGVATYLVNKVYIADQTRANALHHMEHTNRMASIGRLAAGVAHEVNNPLAIINEKAGLIKDMFTFRGEYAKDEKLMANVDAIIRSVERCGAITKRLLGFARHIDVHVEPIRFKELAEEVLGFLNKEAEYRSITIEKHIPDDLPEFVSDRGKLQQIFLNLVNNAFQAMNDGGHLNISASRGEDDMLVFTVQDDGCGIPPADQKRIFDPFFSTKKKKGGTGLGLSITYGLVQELGGNITVDSHEGCGTTFTITMPLRHETNKANEHEDTVG